MDYAHAVVWIDHREARIFDFNHDEVEKMVIRPDNPSKQVHRKAGPVGDGHSAVDAPFLAEIAVELGKHAEILIVGPAQAKLDLIKHLHKHNAAIAAKVVGVESIDHPSDEQIVVYARKYFRAADRMRPR